MKESIQIAYTYAKVFLDSVDPNQNFLLDNNIHLHVPEGATPKDGPSAGIAMLSSLVSLFTQKNLLFFSLLINPAKYLVK